MTDSILILGFTGPHTELGFKTLGRDDLKKKKNGPQAIPICLDVWIPCRSIVGAVQTAPAAKEFPS